MRSVSCTSFKTGSVISPSKLMISKINGFHRSFSNRSAKEVFTLSKSKSKPQIKPLAKISWFSKHCIGVPPVPLSIPNQVLFHGTRAASSKSKMANPTPPKDTIWFYHSQDPYYEFTNFYAAPFELDGKEWPTSEHYFQAQKFIAKPELLEKVRTLKTPREAFNAARTYSEDVRSDWAEVKDGVMHKAVRAKFEQNPQLKEILLNTGTQTLVEHTENDSYWGDGGNGSGLNKLGKTLMKVREELRNSSEK